MTHFRFNRHELFTQQDLSEVLDIIRELRDLSTDVPNPVRWSLDSLIKKLFDMFDGRLHDNVLTTAAGITLLDMVLIRRIEAIVDKIVNDIRINGQFED